MSNQWYESRADRSVNIDTTNQTTLWHGAGATAQITPASQDAAAPDVIDPNLMSIRLDVPATNTYQMSLPANCLQVGHIISITCVRVGSSGVVKITSAANINGSSSNVVLTGNGTLDNISMMWLGGDGWRVLANQSSALNTAGWAIASS
jgi:hypothetical protein